MTFFTRDAAEALFDGFELERFDEEDTDGETAVGVPSTGTFSTSLPRGSASPRSLASLVGNGASSSRVGRKADRRDGLRSERGDVAAGGSRPASWAPGTVPRTRLAGTRKS